MNIVQNHIQNNIQEYPRRKKNGNEWEKMFYDIVNPHKGKNKYDFVNFNNNEFQSEEENLNGIIIERKQELELDS